MLKSDTISQCRRCLVTQRNIANRSVQVGNKYGKLTVIGDGGYLTRNNNSKVHCSVVVCDCGTSEPFIVRDNNLQTGGTTSCGCVKSKGEQKISLFLKKNKVKFIKEYTFDNCRNPMTNCCLRFDFAIFDKENNLNCLIEFDGRQHINGPDTNF